MNFRKQTLGLLANFLVCWILGSLIPILFCGAPAAAFLHPAVAVLLPIETLNLQTEPSAILLLLVPLATGLAMISLLAAWLLNRRSVLILALLHVAIVVYCALGSLAVCLLTAMD